jgi:hypothetical protein
MTEVIGLEEVLCVHHDLKRVNSRALSFKRKIVCISVCVSPPRNANEQQSGDSDGGPNLVAHDRSPFRWKRSNWIRIGRLGDVLRVHRVDLLSIRGLRTYRGQYDSRGINVSGF